jgi:hypothetical protein
MSIRKEERPKLKLKIELELPTFDGAPPQKFCVSRTLKARWGDDHEKISLDILNEIKNYKGSFVGDTIKSLFSLVKAEGKPIKEENSRSVDLARWAASIIDTLVFSDVKDRAHEELLENEEIAEWDGTFKNIGPISPNEVKNVDVEKVMVLLAPKIKHFLSLISKDIDEKARRGFTR